MSAPFCLWKGPMMVLLTALLLLTQPAAAAEPAAPAAEPVAVEAAPAEAEGDRVICKRSIVTGSFAKRRKVCQTAREWTQEAQNARDDARRTQGEGVNSRSQAALANPG